MGIDAEILLRVKGEKPTDEQVAKWGDALCRSLGAKHFFISDGLPSPEYHAAEKAWHEAFNSHELYPQWVEIQKRDRWPKTDPEADKERKQLHQQILADIGQCPEQRRRAIEFTNSIYPLDDDSENIPQEYKEPGRCWTQDGDPIFARPGEWFLEVNVWTRYYGIEYERGDLLKLCGIAEWCEANIPGVSVWYGGDSSGVCAQPWSDKERMKLRQHFYSQQGRAYFDYDWMGGARSPKPKPCGLCIGDGHFSQNGSGPNWTLVHCASCGKSFETKDDGANWNERKEAA